MKLNLWLIANQLNNYDIEAKISAATERTISGPLPVVATGSVYVRNEGTDVICHSDQGTIIIHDMEEKEGFLLIQSIFNWYDSWLENVEEALRLADYRLFVHLCAQAFSNPVLLQDSNYLLLGMDCRGIPIRDIPEWHYIYEKEQSSVDDYLMMSEALQNPVRKYSDCVYRFSASGRDEAGKSYQTGGLHIKFRYFARDYGQLTVLAKKRPLNPGDVALLKLLAEKCSMIFAVAEREDASGVNMRIMNELLEYKDVPKEQLDYHYAVITRKSPDKANRLCLFLFHFDVVDGKNTGIELVKNTLTKQYPTIYNWIYHEDLLVIVYVPEPDVFARQIYSYLSIQGYSKELHIGVSLPFDDLRELPYYYEQAVFAIRQTGALGLSFFYSFACKYLLGNTDMRHKLLACEPACRRMWMEEPDKREFLCTLSVYLGLERATGLAARQMSIHRNTITYRIKYVKDRTGWDYEDAVLRDYLRLSIYYLSAWSEE